MNHFKADLITLTSLLWMEI